MQLTTEHAGLGHGPVGLRSNHTIILNQYNSLSSLASALGVDPPISKVSLTPNQTFSVINVGNGKCRLIYLATTTGAVLYAATRRSSGEGNLTILSGSAIPELTITYSNANDWFSISSAQSIEVNYAILKMGK